jgi:hypothetical protein
MLEHVCAIVERCCDVRPLLLPQLRCPPYFLHGALDEVPHMKMADWLVDRLR